MTMISRDPFAREELHRTCFPAARLTTEGCVWCGNRNARGGLYGYTVEMDAGRTVELRGLYCSVSCFRTYNDAR